MPCRSRRAGGCDDGSAVALLLDLRLLAAELAQVVELRSADVTAGDDLDVVDDRGVHRELALDADLEADLADREGLANALALAADDDALEDLDTRARTFDDVDVHLDGVARAEVGDVRPQARSVDVVEDVHDGSLSAPATGRTRINEWKNLVPPARSLALCMLPGG